MKKHLKYLSSLFMGMTLFLGCQSDSTQTEKTNQKQKPRKISTAALQQKASPNATLRKFFKIKSARIEFVYSGDVVGKETFYFDDWGNIVVIIEDKKEWGNPVRQTSIWKDKKNTIYKHDDPEKKAWQGSIRPVATEPPAIARSTETQLKTVGYARLPDEKIAGKICTVFENKKLQVKYWLWNGIDLKIVNYSLSKIGYKREAISVEENIAVPARLLQPPAGYTIEEGF